MKMNKIRIAKATVNGKESLILITLDPDGKKVCMAMAELDDEGMTEVIVADDGFVTSKDEVGYESYDEDYEGMWEKLVGVRGDMHNLPNSTFLLGN